MKGDKPSDILEEIVVSNANYRDAQSQYFKFVLLKRTVSLERKIRCIYRMFKRRKSK